MRTSPAQRLAGRVAVALLLVLLAAGSALAAASSRPTSHPAMPAEPAQSASTTPSESPEASETPEPAETPETSETPEPAAMRGADEDADASPSPANLARIVERLAAAGITTTTDELAALAEKVGVGGAIRVLRFAEASGKTPAEIVAMREAGKGWGVIARELKLTVNPGNGSVMGQGHGADKADKAAAKAARAAAKAAKAAARGQRKAGSGN
jgi:hypothetical protein